MKTKALLFLSLFAACSAPAQEIPNAGFEFWQQGDPVDWDTADTTFLIYDFDMVTPETLDPYSGATSVRMETLSEPVIGVGDVTLPGIITLGDIIVDAANMTGTIQGGVPYAGKPYSLSGFYKFFPAVQDSAVIGMALYRWNGQSRDTLAIGYFYTGDVAAQWTEFEAVLNYDIYEESDTMNIVASSTAVYAQNLPVGSVLYLDNLALNYGPISVLQPEFSESFIVIPEVWASRIRIETDDTGVPQQADIRLYDLSGQLVAKEKQWSSNGVFYINYRSLNPGIYIIGLITTDGRSFHQKVRIY